MLFEFCKNFLNIEKNYNFIFSKFHVFFAFHAISNIKKKIGVNKIPGGGGGGLGVDIGNFNMRKYWKVPLHLLVKWEMVSPNRRGGFPR